MPVSANDFRRGLGQFGSGVTVVTTHSSSGRAFGLTVSSFCSVSLDPPLVLVCIHNRSEAHAGFADSGVFAVSVLAEGQEEESRHFSSAGPDKVDGSYPRGRQGAALVPGALAHIECRVVATHVAGDHHVYVGEVLNVSARPGRPLMYHGGRYHRLADDGQPT